MLALPPTTSSRLRRVLPWIIALGAFVIALPTLSGFGPTWDLCIGEFAHGELYLDYVLSGDARYLDFSAEGARFAHREPHPDFDQGLYQWYETHPFMGICSAIACRVLWTSLGWFDAMTAHLLPSLLIACALLLVLTRYLMRHAGLIPALATVLALALSPRFLCDALSNPKDGAVGALYVLSTFTALAAFERNSVRWFIGASALLAAAIATKANAVFVPFQLLVYLGMVTIGRRRDGREPLRLPWRGLVPGLAAFGAVYLICSPMLWTDTIARFQRHIAYFLNEGEAFNLDDFSAHYAALVTTPLTVLVLAGIGAFARTAHWEVRTFLVLGALFPFVRTEAMGGVNFDGVRHFLEFYPFLAALAGLGFGAVLDLGARFVRASERSNRVIFAGAVTLACALEPLRATATTWPYGTVYFNALVGGFGGFQRAGHREASDYWAASYWEGFEWIERNAKPGSVVVVPIAPHVARSMAPCRLGPNCSLSTGHPPARGGDVFVMFTTRRLLSPPLPDWVETHASPVFEITRQGGVLCRIYRFERAGDQSEVLTLAAQQVMNDQASRRALEWVAQHPDLVAELKTKLAADPLRAEEILLATFPPELANDVKELLRRIPLDQLFPAPPTPPTDANR